MEEHLIKVIVLGDSSVGKTCFLLKFTDDTFKESHDVTIGVELATRSIQVQDKLMKFQIWDTSGQENYRSVTRSFYRRADCAIIVFDINYRKSFENCNYWLQEIRQNSKENIFIYLVGNKIDLADFPLISRPEAEDYAKLNKICGYSETSAKLGINIEEVFINISNHLLIEQESTNSKESGKLEIQIINQKKKKCC
jgi:small GTP-binding protein